MRVKKGKLWVCLSSHVLSTLANLQDDIHEAVKSKTPVYYQLSQGISLFTEPQTDESTVTFKKSSIKVNLTSEEWVQLMDAVSRVSSDIQPPPLKRRCTSSVCKMVTMYVCYSKSLDNNPNRFYTRSAAEKYGKLNGWDYDTVLLDVQTPSKEVLVMQFLAFKTREHIIKRMTDLCYGCQRDRHSQKDHTCLEPWEEVVQQSYKES